MKVVLAYSGGLDTSVAIKWLQDKGYDVVTFTAELGQDEDLAAIKNKAKSLGAKAYTMDLKDEFVENYVLPAIKANAVYEGSYPLATALARPLIAKYLVEIAEKENAEFVSHGCTGKGNDKVRFDVTINSLNENLKILSPVVEWGMSREQEIEYARQHGIEVPVTRSSPYSIDQNLWGRSAECGILEKPDVEPPEDAFGWTTSPQEAPDKPEYIDVGFESGIPVSLNGDDMGAVELIENLNKTAGKHGVGRIDHVEDRVVGLKSREIYEAPAAVSLITAHSDLQKYVCTSRENLFRPQIENEWSYLVYAGLWMDPLRRSLDMFINGVNEAVTGSVRLKLYKGSVRVAGRKSDYALYDLNLATYDKGDIFNQGASEGFIELWGLQSRMVNRVRKI